MWGTFDAMVKIIVVLDERTFGDLARPASMRSMECTLGRVAAAHTGTQAPCRNLPDTPDGKRGTQATEMA